MLLDKNAFIFLHNKLLLIGACSGPGACIQTDWDFEPIKGDIEKISNTTIGAAVREMWGKCRDTPLKSYDVEQDHMKFMATKTRKALYKNTKATSVLLKNEIISTGATSQNTLGGFSGIGYEVTLPEIATDEEIGAMVRDVLEKSTTKY